MLVGRDAELRELLAAVAGALADGRGFTALIGGEPGIGKTRLATECASRLRADGVSVAWAACRQDGGAPPYWPWVQLLDRLGRAAAFAAADHVEPEFARFLLFDAVAGALRAAAPVVLVLDDLHWADHPSLMLLDALGAHVGVAPVIVLGTYRDTEAGSVAGLTAERRIVLRGLTADDLGPALLDVTGESVTPATAAALHQRTGGNPFFAAEVVRMLRAEGSLQCLPVGAVPSGVRAVLERRLDRLSAGIETALRGAAALDAGTTTGVDTVLLAAVTGVAPAGLAELLAPALTERLLVADEGRYRFPHALVADTVTLRTPAGQRLDLHRRAAAALTLRMRDGTGDLAEVAHHQLAAARLSGDAAEACTAAMAAASAAGTAMDGTAYEDAVGWLEAAIAVLPSDAAEPDRGELLCALGDAALAAGERERSRRAFTAAAERARRSDRVDLLVAAALGVTGGATGFEVDLADPDRLTLLEEALAALPADDSVLRCAVSARLSVALAFTGAEDRRVELADDAVAMARRLGDPRALAVALAAWCDAVAGPDHVTARQAAATEIIVSAHAAHDRSLELLGIRLEVVALAEAGDWAGVDRAVDSYTRVVRSVRQPGLMWLEPLWRGARATMRGDSAAEAEHEVELTRLAEASGSSNAELLQLTQRFARGVLSGSPPQVGVTRFLELAPDLAAASYCTLALLRAGAGDLPEARGMLEAYLVTRAATAQDSEWLPEMVQAAQTAELTGHREAAAEVYANLSPYAGLFAVEGILAATWGCVDAYLAALARMLGRPEAARRHLDAALALNEAAGAALLARTRRSAGREAAATAADAATFRREGELWTLAYHGRAVRLRDTKGLRDLAALITEPGRDLAVHELTGAAGEGGAPMELADRSAIDAYRRRLLDLESDRTEAEAMNDPVRAERAATERDALIDELSAVTGLGGRTRRAGSDAERMRKAVGNRIRQALARIEDVHPELGRHLRVSVRTGTFCRYEPDREMRWEL
jgi:hypothetical protein